jgi:hypothetical protein
MVSDITNESVRNPSTGDNATIAAPQICLEAGEFDHFPRHCEPEIGY